MKRYSWRESLSFCRREKNETHSVHVICGRCYGCRENEIKRGNAPELLRMCMFPNFFAVKLAREFSKGSEWLRIE